MPRCTESLFLRHRPHPDATERVNLCQSLDQSSLGCFVHGCARLRSAHNNKRPATEHAIAANEFLSENSMDQSPSTINLAASH